jgi:hypothetical protein
MQMHSTEFSTPATAQLKCDMSDYTNTKETLTRLAGEGSFAVYKRSTLGQRLFISMKFAANSSSFFLFGSNKKISAENIFFIKGRNQLRLHRRANIRFEEENRGASFLQPDFAMWRVNHELRRWLRIERRHLWAQLCFVCGYLLTGKKRYLNLYFLNYQASMEAGIRKYCGPIRNFVCYNDQSYEAAAIILGLRRLTSAKTVVVQHGLILSPEFYFPVNADEFWAWGELSRKHFSCRKQTTKLLVKGRFPEDQAVKNEDRGASAAAQRPPRILIAPSYKHREILGLVKSTLSHSKKFNDSFELAIKFHPATKFRVLLALYCRSRQIHIESMNSDMCEIAGRFDAIVTRNSTSAIDFMLRGKRIFIDLFDPKIDFPSREYADPISDLSALIARRRLADEHQTVHRLNFLKSAINV